MNIPVKKKIKKDYTNIAASAKVQNAAFFTKFFN